MLKGYGIISVVEWVDDCTKFIGYTNDTLSIEKEKYVKGERRVSYIDRKLPVEGIGNIHDNPELLKDVNNA